MTEKITDPEVRADVMDVVVGLLLEITNQHEMSIPDELLARAEAVQILYDFQSNRYVIRRGGHALADAIAAPRPRAVDGAADSGKGG